MDLGLTMFATDRAISPVDLAQEAEVRGFSSLWLPEHTHIPVSRITPFPGGGDLPECYLRAMDTPTVLAACASVTDKIRLGAGISLAAQHEPLSAAKVWASLDYLSGGRARFGVGFGWNVEEMNSHGVNYKTRRAQVREHVLAMHVLWGEQVAEFHGDFVDIEPCWSWPKPLQRPRIPTYVGGGAGPQLFAAISEYGDGWIPIGGAGVARALPELKAAWTEAGRSGTPEVIPFGTIPSREKLERYGELGITEAVLQVDSVPRDEVLRTLDDYMQYL